MQKAMLTVLGLVGLSLLLCGPADTQTSGTAGSTQTVPTGTEQTSGGTNASTVELQQTVLQLQAEVAQLRQELAQVRAQLSAGAPGVGGSGLAGTTADPSAGAGVAAPQGTVTGSPAPQGTVTGSPAPQGTVTGSPAVQGPSSPQGTAQGTTGGTAAGSTQPSGEAVVNAIYTGTVRSVSDGRLVLLDEEGQPFSMELSDRTRVVRNGQRISVQQLKQGTRVRATVDMLSGRNQVAEVTVLPEP